MEFGDMQFTIEDGYVKSEKTEFTMARFIDCVLASTNENPAPYFRNKVLSDEFPTLQQEIEPLPEYFLPNWLPDYCLVKSVRQTFNRGAAIELYIGEKRQFFSSTPLRWSRVPHIFDADLWT